MKRMIALLLAVWFTDLNLKIKGQGFFKTVIYMPNLIMAAAFSMLFFISCLGMGCGWLDFFSSQEKRVNNSISIKYL